MIRSSIFPSADLRKSSKSMIFYRCLDRKMTMLIGVNSLVKSINRINLPRKSKKLKENVGFLKKH